MSERDEFVFEMNDMIDICAAHVAAQDVQYVMQF